MTAYSDLELRYARPIANALLMRPDFRCWLLSGTKHGGDALEASPIGNVQAQLRSPRMTNPYWFNYWCPKDGRCVCRIGTGIETDILVIFDCANGRRLGVHVEVKRPGDTLGYGQAESYPRRAACWVNPSTRPRTVAPHQDFMTLLVCGRELSADLRLRYFDKVVFHDDVANQIPIYPD